jgi:hypothetical protein
VVFELVVWSLLSVLYPHAVVFELVDGRGARARDGRDCVRSSTLLSACYFVWVPVCAGICAMG